MPKRVTARGLNDACFDDSLPHFPLQNRLIEVMPSVRPVLGQILCSRWGNFHIPFYPTYRLKV